MRPAWPLVCGLGFAGGIVGGIGAVLLISTVAWRRLAVG